MQGGCVTNIRPDVTVAVMSYNNSAYIAQTIESVLAQEGVSLELFVFDDCSTDQTLDVLQRYTSDARFSYEVNPNNLGMMGNYNRCFRAGTGRFVVVLGSDDLLYPGHLASQVAALELHPESDLVYTQCQWIDETGAVTQQPVHPGHRLCSYFGRRDEVVDLLSFDNYITPSAVMFRRAVFAHVQLVDGNVHRPDLVAGVWELWTRIARHNPDFVFLRQRTVGYRVHGGQISQSFYSSSKPLLEHTEILELNLACPEVLPRLRAKASLIWDLYQRRQIQYSQEVRAQIADRVAAIHRALFASERAEDTSAPMFSIILTTYNRPGLLIDALRSVQNQAWQDYELIVINDAGEPVEHVLAQVDMPVTYVRQGRNQGLSAARNAGLKLARGRYIVYLDDDDIYLPNHLAVLAEAFVRHPGSVIYTGVEYVSERLEGEQRIELARSQPYCHEVFDRDRLFTQNYIPVNTWAHPREMLNVVGEFDTGLAAFEDWDMLLRLATHYPFVHVPLVTTEVHTRQQSAVGEHMLGRERKNFPALYQMLYQRYPGSQAGPLQRAREDMLQRLGVSSGASREAYTLQHWLAQRLPTQAENRLINQHLQEQGGGPLIGIMVLDVEGQSAPLMKTLKSLIGEHCLYATLKIVVLTSSRDTPATSAQDKLHFVHMTDEDLAPQLNLLLADSEASWFMLARAGDEFTSSGLMIAGLELAANPGCRAVYGDQLQRLPDGAFGGAFLPAFNLDMLLSFPLVMARYWLFRRDIVLDLGGFDAQFSDALEFDLIARLIEAQGLVGLGHIDEPLVIIDAPVLRDNPDECRVIERHLLQRGYQAQVIPGLPARYRINYGQMDTPMVSIVIALEASLASLQRCVDSLLEKTRYTNYEVLLAAHDQLDASTQAWLQGISGLADPKLQVISADTAMQAQNTAALHAQGDYLLLLSAESVVVSEIWLDELLNHAQRPEVGVVGGKLLRSDGHVDQAGLLLGLRGPASRAFAGEAIDSAGYMQRLQVDQNYTAVGEACLMVRTDIFRQLGGLDVTLSAYRDVDFCLRVRAAGYLTVWAAHALLMHEQEYREPDVAEQDAFYERHLSAIAHDPVYNRNLALSGRGFDLEVDAGLTWRPLTWRPLPVVLTHPADPYGCGHYRVIKPFSALKDAGLVDGMMSFGLLQVPDLERLKPDVIVLQRQIGDDRLEAMRRIKKFSRAFTIYELDDYLPNLPIKSVHRAQMPKDVFKSLRRGLSFVDRFTVSTEPLAEAFSGLHDDIRVIENRLPLDWWSDLSAARRRGAKPRVGWAGGISHTGDLELIFDVVRELAGEVEWVFMGMCPDKIRPYVHEVYAGVDIDRYPAALAKLDLDLALAPVEQNLFNECKSNLRLLEYGACGFPVICSDLVCYRGALPVTRVKNRFKDWVDAIRMHINDLDASASMGDELRRQVREGWMLEGANLDAWRASWLPN